MTEGEIVTSYLQAKKQKSQVYILAQLNAKDPSTIRKILAKHGIHTAPTRKTPKPRVIICDKCGKPFDAHYSRSKFCDECAKERTVKKKGAVKKRSYDRIKKELACADCGKKFLGDQLAVRCPECKKERKMQQQRERRRRQAEKKWNT